MTDERTIGERERALWLALRQALIIALGAIEEYIGVNRTVIPRRKQEE